MYNMCQSLHKVYSEVYLPPTLCSFAACLLVIRPLTTHLFRDGEGWGGGGEVSATCVFIKEMALDERCRVGCYGGGGIYVFVGHVKNLIYVWSVTQPWFTMLNSC